MTHDRAAFPPLDTDDLDARLDRRAALRGIPTLRVGDAASGLQADAQDDTMATEPNHALAELAGQGAVAAPKPPQKARRRVPRPMAIKSAPPEPVVDVPTPRSRMKSLNVELPDYVWIELKSRAAREMVTVRHVIMSLLDTAGIAIAPIDLVEDGRRLR